MHTAIILLTLIGYLFNASVLAFSLSPSSSQGSGKDTVFVEKNVIDVNSSQSRRSLIDSVFKNAAVIAMAASGFCKPQVAKAVEFEDYRDTTFNFMFKLPNGWTKAVQELPDRRKIVLFSDDTSTPIMFVAYTPIRDDFTSLGSFGSVDQVAAQTVLPKGGKGSLIGGEEEIESSMISAVSKNNAYIFDYVVKTEQIPKTHYRSLWTLATKEGNAGFTLVTLNLQCNEEKYSALSSTFDDIIGSFGKLK